MTVQDLLRQSLQAHTRAADLRRRRDPEARAVLIQARDLRLQALALDPDRTDPAWSNGRVQHSIPPMAHPAYKPNYPAPSHDEMMAFYKEQLGEP